MDVLHKSIFQQTHKGKATKHHMDRLSLPFASPIGDNETQIRRQTPTSSLAKLPNRKNKSKSNRKLPSSLLKLANEKKSKLLPQESPTPSISDDSWEKDETASSKSIPVSAYFLLASAVVSLSFIAPLLDLQEGDPIMKIVWRQAATSMMLLLPALSARITEGSWGKDGIVPSAKSWGYAILAGALYSPTSTTFSVSLNYTTVEDAVAFSNAQSLIILIGKIVLGFAVSL